MISIIIPCYNCEKTIETTLDSLLLQPHQEPIEVLAIDDGSSDTTLDLLKEYVLKHPEVMVYSKENGGVTSAVSYGISKANGDYIYIMDSDDKAKKDLLFTFEKETKDFDMIAFGHDKVDSDGNILSSVCLEEQVFKGKEEVHELLKKLYFDDRSFDAFTYVTIYKWSYLVKASIVKKIVDEYRERNMTLYEDLVYTMLCVANCESVHILPYKGISYLQRERSHSRKNMDLDINDLYQLRKDIRSFLTSYTVRYNLEQSLFSTMEFDVSKFYLSRLIRTYSYKDTKKFFKQLKKDELYQKEKKLVNVKGLSFKRKIFFYLLKWDLFTLIYLSFRFVI